MFKLMNNCGSELNEFVTLDAALTAAKAIGIFVTIKGPDGFEVCGIFGVDSVRDGKTPDGHIYNWNKLSRIGRVEEECM